MEAWTGFIAKWNQELKDDQQREWNERAQQIQVLLEETEHYGQKSRQNSAEDEEPKQHLSFAELVDQAFPREHYYDEEEEESEVSAVTFGPIEKVVRHVVVVKQPIEKPAPRDFGATLLAVVSSITKVGKRDVQAKKELRAILDEIRKRYQKLFGYSLIHRGACTEQRAGCSGTSLETRGSKHWEKTLVEYERELHQLYCFITEEYL